jgi:hypothetical protein
MSLIVTCHHYQHNQGLILKTFSLKLKMFVASSPAFLVRSMSAWDHLLRIVPCILNEHSPSWHIWLFFGTGGVNSGAVTVYIYLSIFLNKLWSVTSLSILGLYNIINPRRYSSDEPWPAEQPPLAVLPDCTWRYWVDMWSAHRIPQLHVQLSKPDRYFFIQVTTQFIRSRGSVDPVPDPTPSEKS